MHDEEFDEFGDELSAWPAFVDLLAATSLLLLALLAVIVVWAGSQGAGDEGRILLQKQLLAEALREVSLTEAGDTLFSVDATADLLFVRVTLPEDATFPTNEWQWDSLQATARSALQDIGRQLREAAYDSIYREVRVVGHSDQVPYPSDATFSNWELSAVRAAVVARYLVTSVGVNPCKVSAAGYGPYRPIQPPRVVQQRTPSFLAVNRRIELEFVPMAQEDDASRAGSHDFTCFERGDGTAAAGGTRPDSMPQE